MENKTRTAVVESDGSIFVDDGDFQTYFIWYISFIAFFFIVYYLYKVLFDRLGKQKWLDMTDI